MPKSLGRVGGPEGKSDRWWQVYCAALSGLVSARAEDLTGACRIANAAMTLHGTKDEACNVKLNRQASEKEDT